MMLRWWLGRMLRVGSVLALVGLVDRALAVVMISA